MFIIGWMDERFGVCICICYFFCKFIIMMLLIFFWYYIVKNLDISLNGGID